MNFKQWMKLATGLKIRDANFVLTNTNPLWVHYYPTSIYGYTLPDSTEYVVTGVVNKRLFLKPKFQVRSPSGNLCWKEWEVDSWTILKDDTMFYRALIELE